MSIRMSKNIKEERLRWILPICNKEVRLCDAVKICPYSERSLKRWLRTYREKGEEGLVPKTTEPKTQPNETPIRIKEEIIQLRKETGLCAKKIHWRLKKIKDLSVPVSTIGKILKREGLTRIYRKKKIKYRYIRAERKPGELIEIDVKHVPSPVKDRKYYQYTAIDTASRWRYLAVYDGESTLNSICFLKKVISKFPYRIKAIKTDNHSTFTNYYLGSNKRSDLTVKTVHALDRFCSSNGIVHYLINKGKPAQNGTVERSHREDQEKFYEKEVFNSFLELKEKLIIWNDYYNNLEHCSLNGRTPNEMLNLTRDKVPKEVS